MELSKARAPTSRASAASRVSGGEKGTYGVEGDAHHSRDTSEEAVQGLSLALVAGSGGLAVGVGEDVEGGGDGGGGLGGCNTHTTQARKGAVVGIGTASNEQRPYHLSPTTVPPLSYHRTTSLLPYHLSPAPPFLHTMASVWHKVVHIRGISAQPGN